MFFTGLVSVTFRKFDIAGVVRAASLAGLDGIEWEASSMCRTATSTPPKPPPPQ